jgi:hypothetical protein
MLENVVWMALCCYRCWWIWFGLLCTSRNVKIPGLDSVYTLGICYGWLGAAKDVRGSVEEAGKDVWTSGLDDYIHRLLKLMSILWCSGVNINHTKLLS